MNTSVHLGTALITHATSRIGAIYADGLARRGYDLILADRHLEHLNDIATQLTDETGRSVETLAVDLTDDEHVIKVEYVLKTDASITLLVIDAGVGATNASSRREAAEDGQSQSRSTRVPARLARAVAPAFVAREAGTIISLAWFEQGSRGGSALIETSSAPAFDGWLLREFAASGCRIQHVLAVAESPDPAVGCGILTGRFPQVSRSARIVVDAALDCLDRGELLVDLVTPVRTL